MTEQADLFAPPWTVQETRARLVLAVSGWAIGAQKRLGRGFRVYLRKPATGEVRDVPRASLCAFALREARRALKCRP